MKQFDPPSNQGADAPNHDTQVEEANTRTRQANIRTEEAEARTVKANTQTDEANIRTEQSEARSVEALKASGLLYRRLFETAQDGILILDADTAQVVDANPFMKDLLGYSQEEFLGKKLWEIGPFKGEAASKIAFAELQRADCIRYEGLPLETKAGLRVEVEFISNAYFVDQKKLIQCNIRDITERKKAEAHLQLQVRALEAAANAIVITDSKGVIEWVNPAFTAYTGYSAAEAIGKNPRLLKSGKHDVKFYQGLWETILAGKTWHGEMIDRRKDGTLYNEEITITPMRDIKGEIAHFIAIKQDITKRKEEEEQLLWKTAFLEAQVNSSLDGILILNREGKKILQNQRSIDLWNIPRKIADEADDHRQREWITSLVKNPRQFVETNAYFDAHPDEISHTEVQLLDGRIFERYSAPVLGKDGKDYGRIRTFRDITERKRSEARFRRLVDSNAQGVIFWNTNGEITGANDAFLCLVRYTREDMEAGRLNWMAMTPPEYAESDRRYLEKIGVNGVGAPYEKEYIRKDGSRVPVLLSAAVFEDRPEEGVCFVIDLTEPKKLEAQFMRAQRMESIGTLAGGVAHDLNNILAPIMMAVDILKSLTDTPQATKILETLEVSAKRGADIVRQVLSFARGVEGERIEVQPKHLLKDIETIIRDTFPKDIRLQFSTPNDIWPILGDPTQVHQILLNLCVNARDAMPNGGSLTIGVENCVIDEQYAGMNIEAKPGRYINISVTDSGMGIPQGIIDRIFDPFFTTKELNKGTGLGLSTVMTIVKSHEGFINVYSEPGNGTTFKVYLPAMELSSEARMRQTQSLSPPRGKGETVLVIDDEASILAITSQTLQAFGYRVLTATDGADAMAVYTEHKNEIAVVLTDMAMPVMDGPATIHALTRINPVIKIVAVSGLNANGDVANASRAGVKHFLTKPYTAGILLKTLRTVFDEA